MKTTTGNVITDFLAGAKKGVNAALFSQLPGVVMAYTVIRALEVSGGMTLIQSLFGPLMGIFGLPAEMGLVLVTGWLNPTGAVSMLPALVESGAINGVHIAIALPMLYSVSSQLALSGRILGTIRTPSRYYGICIGLGWLSFFIMGFLGRIVTAILF